METGTEHKKKNIVTIIVERPAVQQVVLLGKNMPRRTLSEGNCFTRRLGKMCTYGFQDDKLRYGTAFLIKIENGETSKYE